MSTGVQVSQGRLPVCPIQVEEEDAAKDLSASRLRFVCTAMNVSTRALAAVCTCGPTISRSDPPINLTALSSAKKGSHLLEPPTWHHLPEPISGSRASEAAHRRVQRERERGGGEAFSGETAAPSTTRPGPPHTRRGARHRPAQPRQDPPPVRPRVREGHTRCLPRLGRLSTLYDSNSYDVRI